MMQNVAFTLSSTPLDPQAEAARLADPGCGALVTFEGWVRRNNQGREVISLEYSAYEALAIREGTALLREVGEATGCVALRCVHRIGRLEIGDRAVWIGVTGAHRKEAFDACERVLEELKKRVPIWKKEFYADGRDDWLGERFT